MYVLMQVLPFVFKVTFYYTSFRCNRETALYTVRAGFITKSAPCLYLQYSWELDQNKPGSLVSDVSMTFSRLNKNEN